jgi:hypothetical protein
VLKQFFLICRNIIQILAHYIKVDSFVLLRNYSTSTMPAKKFWPSLSVNSKKKNCNPYFIVIMITVLIMNVIFWVVNFKTQNYFVISTTQNVYLRLSMYDCSNFVHSCRIFGISELQTV